MPTTVKKKTRSRAPVDLCLPQDADVKGAVALFGAMAHAGRLRTLLALCRLGPLSVSALMEHTALEQTALSHQLRILRDGNLVTTQRQGKAIIYALADRHIAHLIEDAIAHAGELAPRRRT